MTPMRRRITVLAAPALLALSLTACGGGSGGDAPDDASKEEFCKVFSDDSTIENADDAKDFGEKLADVGTPSDITGDAREGFEIFVDKVTDLSDDDVKKFEEAEDPSGVFDEDDAKKVTAFITEAATACVGDLDIPTDIPS